MSQPGDGSPHTALTRRPLATGNAALATEGAHGQAPPKAPVQRAMVCLLEAAVDAWGQVVSALLFDLDQISEDMQRFSWLSRTMDLLAEEQVYRAAVAQLQWWDTFLQGLPLPQLISDQREREQRAARAERSRAVLQARSRALAEHRRLVAAELGDGDWSGEQRAELVHIHDDPDRTVWRVDPDLWVQQALAALPPLPENIPIGPQDLDPQFSFSGFNAARAMREHPELGPRAARMEASLATALAREFALTPAQAAQHAQVLTDMFWLALRRALAQGGHELAASIHLFVTARQATVQEKFAREVLRSGLHYLEQLPPAEARRGLSDRIPLLKRLTGHDAEPEPAAPRQLAGPAPSSRSVWQRLKGAFSSSEDEQD